jgi:hypothetical protein
MIGLRVVAGDLGFGFRTEHRDSRKPGARPRHPRSTTPPLRCGAVTKESSGGGDGCRRGRIVAVNQILTATQGTDIPPHFGGSGLSHRNNRARYR